MKCTIRLKLRVNGIFAEQKELQNPALDDYIKRKARKR